MARYTLEEAEAFYGAAKQAYLNALTNKSYGVAGRTKENQSVDALKKEMDRWAGIVAGIKSGRGSGIQVARGIPRV